MFITDVYFMSPNTAILKSLAFNLALGFFYTIPLAPAFTARFFKSARALL